MHVCIVQKCKVRTLLVFVQRMASARSLSRQLNCLVFLPLNNALNNALFACPIDCSFAVFLRQSGSTPGLSSAWQCFSSRGGRHGSVFTARGTKGA